MVTFWNIFSINYKRYLLFYLLSFIFSWILIIVFGAFTPPQELIFSLNEDIILLFSGILIMEFYFNWTNRNIKNRISLSNSKLKVKINLFLQIYLLLVFIFITFWISFYLYDWVFDINSKNLFQGQPFGNDKLIYFFNSDYSYAVGYYFYALFIESIIMLTFWYFFSHFFKQSKTFFYLIIIVFIYSLFFGNTLKYFVYQSKGQLILNSNCIDCHLSFGINYFLLPWNQLGFIANRAYSNNMVDVNFWDYSIINHNLPNFYKSISWFWILYVILFLTTPMILNRFKK